MGTGYVYDPIFLEHDQRGHPESRQRLIHVQQALEDYGLLTRMEPIAANPIDLERLQQVHDASYVATVRRVSEQGGGLLDMDTYVAPRSYEAALAAAGGTVNLVGAILDEDLENGIALVRPPGHHALRTRGMGFCLFNNIAVAAEYALQEGGLERVLIFDFDVHHGNGTQDTFYADPRVLYFSLHQYPHYPGTGHWRELGEGTGRGSTANVPLSAGVGDEGVQLVLDELLCPLARRFQPQLLLVSAGYDAHWSDPLAGLSLSLAGYAQMSHRLRDLANELCDGRIAYVLEGGYNLQVLGEGVINTCLSLLGSHDFVDSLGPASGSEREIKVFVDQLRKVHQLL